MLVDRMTEHDVQRALAMYVEWWRVCCVPNLCRWHEMDIAVMTTSGYLWEYEIKVTQSDWNRDIKKRHRQNWFQPWAAPVKRFYYVYARGLVCPDWVHEGTGLIEASWQVSDGWRHKKGEQYVNLKQMRGPKDRKVQKIKERDQTAIWRSAYHRYWQRMLKDEKVSK